MEMEFRKLVLRRPEHVWFCSVDWFWLGQFLHNMDSLAGDRVRIARIGRGCQNGVSLIISDQFKWAYLVPRQQQAQNASS